MYRAEFASGEFAQVEFSSAQGGEPITSMDGTSVAAFVGGQVSPADLTSEATSTADFAALQLGVGELAWEGLSEFSITGGAENRTTWAAQAASYAFFDGQGDPVLMVDGTSGALFAGEAWAQTRLQASSSSEASFLIEEYPVERSVDMAGSAAVQWAFTYVASAPLQSDGGSTADFAGTVVVPVDTVATLAGSSLAVWRSRQQMSPGVETAIRQAEIRSTQRPYEPRSVQRPEPD